MVLLALTASLVMFLGGVLAQATPPPDAAAIPPGVWRLVAFTPANGEAVTVADPSRYTLEFLPDGELAAQVDCNRGRGGYTAMDGVLTVTPMATTKMYCGSASHDAVFRQLLTAATSYQIDGDGALVLSGSAGTLRLRLA